MISNWYKERRDYKYNEVDGKLDEIALKASEMKEFQEIANDRQLEEFTILKICNKLREKFPKLIQLDNARTSGPAGVVIPNDIIVAKRIMQLLNKD